MTYTERINFVEEYINHWTELEECTPIENGFKCRGCSAIFVEHGFNILFGFYDPNGRKLAEYLFNTESGIAIMIYDARYAGYRNDYTGILADILGGLIGARYFKLLNKPKVIYTDAPEPMSIKDIVTQAISKIIEEDKKP
jgi:hypothetical protein